MSILGNPWGTLARNWDYDPQERVFEPKEVEPIKKISLRTGPSKSILNRIGEKSGEESENEEEPTEKPKNKKSKIPRMKMYADEEEAKQKRRQELKQIKKLEAIEQKLFVPDLRSRLGRKKQTTIIENNRPLQLKKTLINERIENTESEEESSEYSDNELNVSQRSKIAVVVRKRNKPTVASTVWSRLDHEKRLQIKREFSDNDNRNESETSDSDSTDSESQKRYRKTLSKTVNERPGFKTTDLKSRLGFQPSEHKSPLRIEINNDHYKNK